MNLPSPCYIVCEKRLTENLKILRQVADAAGCKILLAQKAFSMYVLYPLIGQYLDGTCASGLHEAMLSHEFMGKENHVFAAAYSDEDLAALLPLCNHIIFNSFSQWERFCKRYPVDDTNRISFGIRINPELSTQGGGIYDPCAPGSRLGVTAENFRFDEFQNNPALTGLHFHALCQQNVDALEATLAAAEKKFAPAFAKIKWLNMGGGHHITRADYDRNKLIALIRSVREKYGCEVYLEPGEAVALNAGFLECTVLDTPLAGHVFSKPDAASHGLECPSSVAILDTSAACHMPDVLEMPYRPPLQNSGAPGEFPYTYRLGGPTCLAGDFIGEYSFNTPLTPGTKLIFEDMAIYTMVKNTTFNGINLPSIAIRRTNGTVEVIRRFGYEDFKGRL